ncbi:DUF421 domain-containing protein [Paenibacillus sp. GCM10027627]|uniref:DUF421 domain-containing protein n=1 Tax=unclassified Paenibacillus TaxID=185978 RepID=UPI003631E9C0
MHHFVEIILRTVASIFLLLLTAKIVGKQTLSNMTFHDFVTGITLGAIAANLAFNVTLKASSTMLSLVLTVVISLLLSKLALKNRRIRNWISGSPTVLMEGGRILEENMRKVHYTLDSLDQALREKGIFNIDEVEYAVLEDNGRVSALKKEEYRNVSKKDLHIPVKPQAFPIELIMDGILIEKNLKENGLTQEWLLSELRRRGKGVSDVFYAVRGTRQQLILDYYEDGINRPIDRE